MILPQSNFITVISHKVICDRRHSAKRKDRKGLFGNGHHTTALLKLQHSPRKAVDEIFCYLYRVVLPPKPHNVCIVTKSQTKSLCDKITNNVSHIYRQVGSKGITSFRCDHFGKTISVPPILLLYVFRTNRFGANSVLFDSSLI